MPTICLPRAGSVGFQGSGPGSRPQVSLLPGSPSTTHQHPGQPFHSENYNSNKSSSNIKYFHRTCYRAGPVLCTWRKLTHSILTTTLSICFMDEGTKAQRLINCPAEKAGCKPSSLAPDRDMLLPSLLCQLSCKHEFPQSHTQREW